MNLSQQLYVQLIKTLSDRVNDSMDNDDAQNMSTIIQFFEAPYDEIALGSTVITTLSVDPTANLVWASSSVTSGFTWDSGGVYDAFSAIAANPTDQITLSASTSVTSAFAADLAWGSATIDTNWSWCLGGIYS